MRRALKQPSGWNTTRLGLTIPFVLYGIFRYLYLVHQKRAGGSPADLLLTDRPLLACVGVVGPQRGPDSLFAAGTLRDAGHDRIAGTHHDVAAPRHGARRRRPHPSRNGHRGLRRGSWSWPATATRSRATRDTLHQAESVLDEVLPVLLVATVAG